MKQTGTIRHESKRKPGGILHAAAKLLRENKPGLLACLVAIVLCSAFAGAVASAQNAVPENPAKTYNATASTVAWTGNGYNAPTDDGPSKEKPKEEVTVELPPEPKEQQETIELDTSVNEDVSVDFENDNPVHNNGGDNPDGESEPVMVPDVVGKSAAEAKHLIELADLVPDGPNEGTVSSQIPAAGTEVDRASLVEFFVEDDKVKVPDVFGLNAAEARQVIENAALIPKGDAEGIVVDQDPAAGAEILRGSVVEYFVQAGEPSENEPGEPSQNEPGEPNQNVPEEPEEPYQNDGKVEMPNILGLSASDAKAVLTEFGLIPDGPDEGTVISQQPEAHTMLYPGETVYFDVEAAPEFELPTQCSVPNVIGMSVVDAVAAIIAAGLTPNGPDEGTVIEQEPAGGTQLDTGATVSYSVENAEPTPVGTIMFTLEANTIGIGTLIEPTPVDVYEGEALPEVLERVLPQYGFEFKLDGGYLSYIKRAGITDGWEISENLLTKIEQDGSLNDHHQDTLGEFDFTGGSGWIYFVNDEKMSTGMNSYYPPDGDVVRLHFQLFDDDDKY